MTRGQLILPCIPYPIRLFFYFMKRNAFIAPRLLLATLLIVATAGVSVHQHFCSMMGASASFVPKTSCCASGEPSTEDAASISRIPCCQDEMQTAAVDQSFEAPTSLVISVYGFCPALPANEVVKAPRELIVQRVAQNISPHLLLSAAENINHLRS
jgi:hypothetical protein